MSLKNQRTLLISTAVIVGLTVVALVGLSIIVDKISKLAPSQLAVVPMPPPPPANKAMFGTDDALEKLSPPPPRPDMHPPFGPGPEHNRNLKNQKMPPEMREKPPSDGVRRVRGGKGVPDVRQAPAGSPSSKDDSVDPNSQKGRPSYPYPPDMRGGYPPSLESMSPEERKRFEEMQQRFGPPPPYYPPAGSNGGVDDYYPPPPGYDRDYDEDYDYFDDREGKQNNPIFETRKTAHAIDEEDEEDFDEFDADEYLDEFMD